MSALDAVLQIRAQKQANDLAQAQSIQNAFGMFQQARQQAIANNMAMMQYKARLAEKGLVPDQSTSSGFRFDPTTLNPMGQFMTGLKMQADAKQAGNKSAYDMTTGMLNSLMPGSGGQSVSPVASTPNVANAPTVNPSTPEVAINNPIGSAVATTGQMTPTGQTSSTDPITGQTTGTTTLTNIPAKAAETKATDLAKAQVDASVGSARDTAQMQMIAQTLNNLNSIHKELSDKGFAGNALSQSVADHYNILPPTLQDKFVPKDIQSKMGRFISARNETLVKIQPILSQQFGQAGTSRIMESLVNLSKGEIGDLNTPHAKFEGQTEGTLGSLYRIKLASDKYIQGLKDAGQPIPTDEKAVTQGIYANMATLSPAQEKQLQSMTSSTLGKNKNVYESGQSKNINGINYVRQKDGKWLPQS